MNSILLKEAALKLSPFERAQLIDVLWQSLDPVEQTEIDQAWLEESGDRLSRPHARGHNGGIHRSSTKVGIRGGGDRQTIPLTFGQQDQLSGMNRTNTLPRLPRRRSPRVLSWKR